MKYNVKNTSGFTLLEIIVVLAIIGVMMGIVTSGMNRLLDTEMKQTSSKIGSTIRFLYNKSATDGLYIKLILDIKENSYWVEATTDPIQINKSEDSKFGSREKEDKKTLFEDAESYHVTPKEPSFTKIDSYLLKPSKLPGEVFFKDVYVEHLKFPADAGQVAIHFFPSGYVENAVINLRNDDDDIFYSIKTKPISGRVTIESGYRSLED